jgi:hypothetical protein
MAISVDAKAYTMTSVHGDYCEFVAIVPIYSEYGKGQGDRPINHIKITGYTVSAINFDYCGLAPWHPDNPFADEKFIEIRLHLCQHKLENGTKVEYRSRVGWCNGDNFASHRFFVSAKQLQPLHRMSEKVYRSKDRAAEDAGITVQAWDEMNSRAIANSYY